MSYGLNKDRLANVLIMGIICGVTIGVGDMYSPESHMESMIFGFITLCCLIGFFVSLIILVVKHK